VADDQQSARLQASLKIRDRAGRRGILLEIFGAFMPVWLWQWAHKKVRGYCFDIFEYTAIRPDCLAELDLAAMARGRSVDFSFRPQMNSYAARLLGMTEGDNGDFYKGMLAGWGVDCRDPLADRRLAEYSLNIPTEEYLADGVPRSLARRAFSDRLPEAVRDNQSVGYQASDWHEGLTAARAELALELDRLAACTPARRTLDLEKMKRLVKNWPSSGWEGNKIEHQYRLALLGGISAGHFLRKASGANQ
jgi:asparagine synthase (glutamine-hydrolysing)